MTSTHSISLSGKLISKGQEAKQHSQVPTLCVAALVKTSTPAAAHAACGSARRVRGQESRASQVLLQYVLYRYARAASVYYRNRTVDQKTKPCSPEPHGHLDVRDCEWKKKASCSSTMPQWWFLLHGSLDEHRPPQHPNKKKSIKILLTN